MPGKRFKADETITFSDEDPVPSQLPHSDPMVVSAEIQGFQVKRVFVDSGSSVEIMFTSCFDQLGIRRQNLRPSASPLSGFTGKVVVPLGMIALKVTMVDDRDRGEQTSVLCNFAIIDAASPYNVIIGRPWISQARAVCSLYHLTMKFPTEGGIATVMGDQLAARSCMVNAIKEARRVQEPKEEPRQEDKPDDPFSLVCMVQEDGDGTES